jgi:hypothetical protein
VLLAAGEASMVRSVAFRVGVSFGPALLLRSDVVLLILRGLRGRRPEATSWEGAKEEAPDAAGTSPDSV